jgi:hypothetical protein
LIKLSELGERILFKRTVSETMITLLLIGMLTLAPNIQSVVSQSDLIGYWRFDEGSGAIAYDSSGNGNHATVYGATWTAKTHPEWTYHYALSFDGVDDYVQSNGNIFPVPTIAHTFAMWFKLDNDRYLGDGLENYGLIEGSYVPDTWNHNYLYISSGYLTYYYGTGYLSARHDFQANVWYFVTIASDGGNRKLYLNGSKIAESTDGTGTSDQLTTIVIGANKYFVAADFFKGTIDEVRIYNGVLSEEEIKKLGEVSYDVAVVNMRSSRTVVGQGYSLDINVTIANYGDFTENVSAVVFSSHPSYATSEQVETFWSMGDANIDGYIDQLDIDFIVKRYMFTDHSPADINKDGIVSMVDISICLSNLGKDIYTYFSLSPKPIGKQIVINLPNGTSTVVSVVWNTSGSVKGSYTISAYTSPILGEIDIRDNNFTNGVVKITIPGDVDGDFKVKLEDITSLLDGFGSTIGPDGWYRHTSPCIYCPHNPNLDIDWDAKIALSDITTALDHFGETYP